MTRKTLILLPLLRFSFTALAFAACVADKDDTYGDDAAGTFGSLSATSPDAGDESSDGEDPDPEPQPDPDPEPQPEPEPEPEPEETGDAEPEPLCGDDMCDATAEDWTSCWRDCNAEAPMLPLVDLNPSCVGQRALFDGAPTDEFLWVNADTMTLMHVDGDTVVELGGSSVSADGGVTVGDAFLGSIDCHQVAVGQCAPAIVEQGWALCTNEQVPHAPPPTPSLVIDFTVSGVGYDYTADIDFVPCEASCGNGVCDADESFDGCGPSVSACAADCG